MKMSYLGVTRKYISKLLVKLKNKINIGRLNMFFLLFKCLGFIDLYYLKTIFIITCTQTGYLIFCKDCKDQQRLIIEE